MVDRKLLELANDAKKHIFLAVLYQWVALAAQAILVMTLAHLLADAFERSIRSDELTGWLMISAAAIVTRSVCHYQATLQSQLISETIKIDVRQKLLAKLFSLRDHHTHYFSTATLSQIAAEGVDQLESYFSHYIPQFFYSMLAPLSLFAFLSFFSLKVATILLICVPLIPLSIIFVQKIAKRLLNKYWHTYNDLGDRFLENISTLTTLKLFSFDQQKADEMDVQAQLFRKATMRVLIMQLNSISVMDLVAYGGAGVALISALGEYAYQTISLATLLMFIMLSLEFFVPMRILGSYFHVAMNGASAGEKILEILAISTDSKPVSAPLAASVLSVQNLTHYYGNKMVLEGISFTLAPGQMVAVVGMSGSGKSTLAAVLSKTITPTRGTLHYHRDFQQIAPSDWYEKMTLVSSDSSLFKGSVKDNLRMGQPSCPDETMIAILKTVRLWELFSFNGGLDFLIAERGSNLSGGEKQRLALARALLKDASLYIFDEATSNIDSESEAIIMAIIKGLTRQNKSVLLISHRLANVTDSNWIIVLNEGIILEQGTHEQLMKTPTHYATLFALQQNIENLRGIADE